MTILQKRAKITMDTLKPWFSMNYMNLQLISPFFYCTTQIQPLSSFISIRHPTPAAKLIFFPLCLHMIKVKSTNQHLSPNKQFSHGRQDTGYFLKFIVLQNLVALLNINYCHRSRDTPNMQELVNAMGVLLHVTLFGI